MPEMSQHALLELLDLFESNALAVWLDGGWAVDAMLGVETRTHKDVDIEISLDDVPKLQQVLASRGFTVREGTVPHSFVLGDDTGLEVDVHAVKFNERGDGLYKMENGEYWNFTREALSGRGTIGGRSVRCLTPEHQVECHAYGYTLTEKDLLDMKRLAEKFDLSLPPGLIAPILPE